MWNNNGCRPLHNTTNCCNCGCCPRNRNSALQNSLYVLTTPYQGPVNPAQILCPCDVHDPCSGGAKGAVDCGEDEGRDMTSLLENVPSDSQAARCIEKLQHLVLVKVKDPAVSLKCLQDLFVLKKVLVLDDCLKKKAKKKEAKKKNNVDFDPHETEINEKPQVNEERRYSDDSQGSYYSNGSLEDEESGRFESQASLKGVPPKDQQAGPSWAKPNNPKT